MRLGLSWVVKKEIYRATGAESYQNAEEALFW
jgi:hypothetical protein